MTKRLAVVLAAGKGTRMKSDTYKVLHPINGISMVEHVLRAVQQSNVERTVTIVGHGAESVQEVTSDQTEFAYQDEQLGTGHAVLQAKELLHNEEGSTLVICGDTPLFSGEILEELFDFHESNEAQATILTAINPNPSGYGRLVRYGDGEVSHIVEHKDATPEQRAITEINTGTYIFDNKALFEALEKVTDENAQGEYYLTDVVGILKEAGGNVKAFIMDNYEEAIGVNDRVSLADATVLMTRRINEQHMRNGVTIVNPANTYIEVDAQIGSDTVIEPGVNIKGSTIIGKNCVIGSHSEIRDSQIADNVVITQSVIEESNIASHVKVGPFAHLRPNSTLSEHVKIGNFVEIKNSSLGEGTKAGHLSYIGDAELGQDVNVGCGTVFSNYDGKKKNHSVVGSHTFIGSNTNLIAPINIGERVIIAAGSVVTSDVPDEALAIARTRQQNKENYWERFKQK